MSATERLLQYIDLKGISKYRFYKETGLSNGFLDKKSNIGSDKCEKISYQYPDINLEWLITGKGEILKNRDEDLISGSKPARIRIPFYDRENTAGIPEPSGTIDVGDLLSDSEAAIRIYGNSMTPDYPSGSIIGIKLNREGFITPGSVYIVETTANRYLKRLYYNNDKTAYLCYSDNTMMYETGPLAGQYLYPAFEISFSSVTKLYDVTGVIKRN